MNALDALLSCNWHGIPDCIDRFRSKLSFDLRCIQSSCALCFIGFSRFSFGTHFFCKRLILSNFYFANFVGEQI